MTTRLRRLLRRIGASSAKEAANKIGVSAASVRRWGREGLPEKRRGQVALVEARRSGRRPAVPAPREKPAVPPPRKKPAVPPPRKKPAVPPPRKKPTAPPSGVKRLTEAEQARALSVSVPDLREARAIARRERRGLRTSDLELARLRRLERERKKRPKKTRKQRALDLLNRAVENTIDPETLLPNGEVLYQYLARELDEYEADIFSELLGSPKGIGIAA